MAERLQARLKQNKSDLRYQLPHDLIEVLEGWQVGKLVSFEDMIPEQLASMQERILPPLNQDLLLDSGVAL